MILVSSQSIRRRRPMETFAKLFERFLVFVYHCFDRIVIQGYLPLLTRPEHVVHFFRDVHGQYPITPQVLAKRTLEYRDGWKATRQAPAPAHGAPESTRGLPHDDEHGNGQYVYFEDAQVSYR